MQIIKKIKQVDDIHKWSFASANSDHDGKSSYMPLAGAFLVLVGGIMSVVVTFTGHPESLSQFVFMAGLGASVLVGRKIMGGQPQLEDTPINDDGTCIVDKCIPDSPVDVPENG